MSRNGQQRGDVRAAIYLRVSLDATGEGLAVERQREDCERIVKERGWIQVATYTDNSISAYNKAKARPNYDRMVDDYTAGRFDALVCWDLDRLTRQPRQLEDWIDAAEERSLKLVTANGEADLSTDGGRMYARIKAAVARAEMERKGARQSRAHQQRAGLGRPPRGIRATGYTLDGEIIPDEARAIRAVFETFAVGASLRGIANALSGDVGVAVPNDVPRLESRTGRRWNPSSILGILRNPRYAGWSSLGGEIIRDESGAPVEGRWDGIVSDRVWLEVQARLDDPARITNRVGTERKHLGSGLFVCGVCRAPVKSHSERYRCAGHVLRTRAPIDSFVKRVVELRLDRPDAADLLTPDSSEALVENTAEIDTQRGRIARARSDYAAELIDGLLYKEICARAEGEISRLQANRIMLTSNPVVDSLVTHTTPGQAFLDADLPTMRKAIDGLMTVALMPAPRGRRTFDPESVQITWRS